jgi:uncharacterized protein
MKKRRLGDTGLELSLIGQGGFHLVELTPKDAAEILGTYLDLGGNYIETAFGYGDGDSESKIGDAVSHRRGDFVLATKTVERGAKEAALAVDESLRRLKTDYLDVMFIHGVLTTGEVDAAFADDGVFGALEKARQQGKIRFIAASGHGQQDALFHMVQKYPVDIIMTIFNYYDNLNYPKNEAELLPACIEKGIGVLGMKFIADGYLYRSWETALRYCLSLPITCMVAGMNTLEHVRGNMKLAESFSPVTTDEKEEILKNALELKDYVCRQCGKCERDGFDPSRVFLLEGLFDRQMDDKRIGDAAEYALRQRLKYWFAQYERAQNEYKGLDTGFDPAKDYSSLNKLCPYGIDIERKLKIAHGKLTGPVFPY